MQGTSTVIFEIVWMSASGKNSKFGGHVISLGYANLDWREQTIGFWIWPGFHHSERFRIFATTLEASQLVDDFQILKPVLETELFFEEIAVLAGMLPESQTFLLEFLRNINIMIRLCGTVHPRWLEIEHGRDVVDG